MNDPIITVVVCTYNRAHYLEKCLLSLEKQHLPAGRYEIIVVDNNSTDNTRDICDRFRSFENFTYLFEPVPGLSQARNTGLAKAKGAYVGYIDDDARAVPGWLESVLAGFSTDPEPDWVGGPVTLEWEIAPPRWLGEEYFGALGWVDWGDAARVLDPDKEWLVGCNSVFRKTTLERLNGFDTRLGRKKNLLLSGEELQLHHRLKRAGGIFYYHPKARIHHLVNKERAAASFFYRRYYWGGITDYIMQRTLVGIPSRQTAGEAQVRSRWLRLFKNGFRAAGLFVSQDDAVKGRIYMAYVLGQVMAATRYGWRRFPVES